MKKVFKLATLAFIIASLSAFHFPSLAQAKEIPPGFDKGKKKGWKGEKVPPGWSKGKKTGWNGEKLPPGLFKKQTP